MCVYCSFVILVVVIVSGDKFVLVGDVDYKLVKIWEVDGCNDDGDFEFES